MLPGSPCSFQTPASRPVASRAKTDEAIGAITALMNFPRRFAVAPYQRKIYDPMPSVALERGYGINSITFTRSPHEGTLPDRIVGLDALRAVLLSYGILVHTANVKIEPVFWFIERSSSLFRMDAFFFLSGLLTALTIVRLPPHQWLRGRTRAIGIPLLFGLLVLNPLFFLVQHFAPKSAFMAGFVERNHFDWALHLWFLFSLMTFAVIAFAIRAWRLKNGGHNAPERADLIPASPQRSAMLMWSVLAFPVAHCCVTFVMRKLPYDAAGLGSVSFIIRSTVAALPFYLLGYLMPTQPRLRMLFSSKIYWLVGVLAIPLIANQLGVIRLVGREAVIISGIGRPAFALAFILMTTPLFIQMKTVPAALRSLSEAAYTMYIVHLLLISILLYTFAWLDFGIYSAAITTATLAFALSLGLHFGLVKRSAWLRFLLNGRSLPTRRPKCDLEDRNVPSELASSKR